MHWSRIAVVVVSALLVACDRAASDTASSGRTEEGGAAQAITLSEPAAAPAPPSAGDDAIFGSASRGAVAGIARPGAPGSRTEAQSGGVDPGSVPVDAIAPMIIRTGNAIIEVKSIEPAVAQLRVIASQLGGYVGNTTIQSGKEQPRTAMVEVKVPSSRWGSLLEGLKPVGTVETLSESAQDVGEEFVDVQARIENSRRLEQRLISLLANRTGRLQDALEVERELGRVRGEIERFQGRLRYLQTRAAVSTMLVNLHEPRSVIGSQPGDSPILDAFRRAWQNLIGFIAAIIASMGILLPIAVIILLLWWLARRLGLAIPRPGRDRRPPDA